MSTGVGTHPALALMASAVEDVRKAAAMLTTDEVWTCTDADLELMLRAQAQLDSAAAAVGVRGPRGGRAGLGRRGWEGLDRDLAGPQAGPAPGGGVGAGQGG